MIDEDSGFAVFIGFAFGVFIVAAVMTAISWGKASGYVRDENILSNTGHADLVETLRKLR